MLDNISNQSCKFRAENALNIWWHTCKWYNTNSQIKFKTIILKWSLCDYSDVYILVKETIKIKGQGAAERADEKNIQVALKKCAPLSDRIIEINNT